MKIAWGHGSIRVWQAEARGGLVIGLTVETSKHAREIQVYLSPAGHKARIWVDGAEIPNPFEGDK